VLFHKFSKLQSFIRKEKVFLILIAAAFLGGILGSLFFFPQTTNANIFSDIFNNLKKEFLGEKYLTPSDSGQVKEQEKNILSDYEEAITGAVEKTSPAVVSIIISKDLPVIEQCPYNPFSNLPQEFQQFFGGGFQFYQPCQKGTKKQEVGGGSGFVVSSDGLIVTNKHVVSDTKAEYTVLTNDGKKYTAKVLDRHPSLDLAVIKISAGDLPTVVLGKSSNLKLGQTAIAIGNALGEFRNTVSVGVVSGLARSVTASDGQGQSELIENVIQTDAAINPGNSGGPLINSRGEVIGINVAMVSGAQNIGFAIPIDAAKKSIESVQSSGKIKVAFLGIRYTMLNAGLAEKYSLSVEEGAFLKGDGNNFAVEPDSPADKAGLKEGDVLVKIDGQKINKDNTPVYVISQKSPGDKVTVKFLRKGEEMTTEVILGERKQ